MIVVLYFFQLLQIWLGALSVRGGVRFLRYVQEEIAKPPSLFSPVVSIIAPCRGLDNGLAANLTALFNLNYPHYEIIFAVDDERDAAVSVIRDVMNANAGNVETKLVIAGCAAMCGQKVYNLLAAIEEISPAAEVLVFVDSDARPNADWLRSLIAPLADKNIGAATGYRWFVSKKGNFASQLRVVWNASIASALGAKMSGNFCWGGATAIRRETFNDLQIREKWRGAASDDFALTNALKAAGFPIYFVPQCLTASIEDCIFAELLEFTTRQLKITRVYAPALWKALFVGSFLFTAVFWTSAAVIIWRAAIGESFWLPLAFFTIIFTLGAIKARLRLSAVKLVLPDYQKQLNHSEFWHLTLWSVTPALFFYNCLRAGLSRRICWRGIVYELKSPVETVIIGED